MVLYLSEPTDSLDAMSSASERGECSISDIDLSCHGAPHKAFWTKQASHAESTYLPDECSLPSVEGSDWTLGEELQNHLDRTILQAALAECDKAVHVIDPRNPGLPIIAVSEGMSILTGYHQQELLGNSCRLLSADCPNDQTNIARLRLARSMRLSFETILVNKKKSGQLYRVFLVLRHVLVGSDQTTGEDRGFLLGVQVELPHGDEHDDQLTLVMPELSAQTQNTADELALRLSRLLHKSQDSGFCPEECSILQAHTHENLWLAKTGLGLAPLLMISISLATLAYNLQRHTRQGSSAASGGSS